MREAVVDLMSEPEIGLLDKIGLARRDWQPPRWKRKQKRAPTNRAEWPRPSRKTALCDVTWLLWDNISSGKHTNGRKWNDKDLDSFLCIFLLVHLNRKWVFSGRSWLSSGVPAAIVSTPLMDSFFSLCLPLLFSPISYPCIPPGAD